MGEASPPPEMTVGDARYTLDPSLTSVKRGAAVTGRAVVFEANEPALAVVRATELRDGESALGPVYRSAPGGSIAVPTGRVFVRTPAGKRVDQHADALREAGYVVATVPGWAPEAAWLEASDGTIQSALAGLPALGRVPALVHVEPELLRPRERRADDRRP